VPLNSPRLLIRLTRCRKSGTVPLNSPRLLIRHEIPSIGLHTNKSQATRGVYIPPDMDSLCNTKHQYYKIRDITTSTGDTSRRTPIDHSSMKPDDINRDQMPQYFLLTVGDLIPRATSKSTMPIISLRSRHRHERSFDIATYASMFTFPLFNYSTLQFNPYLYSN